MKKFMSSTVATVVLFALAAVLLGYGGVNAIQAAPRIESSDYKAQVQLSNINVAIVENDKVLSTGDTLLTGIDKASFQVGKEYKEELKVKNTRRPDSTNEGEGIDEYVRVTVYRYWTDNSGKRNDLNPDYIQIHFLTDKGWTIDDKASTPERTVLYYKDIVPVDRETALFADKISIDGAVSTAVVNGTHAYDKDNNVQFHIKVTADAVQTHNGTQAMKSAWGRTNE